MSEIEGVVARLQQCAQGFRLGRDVEAAMTMVQLMGAIQPLIDTAPQEQRQDWEALLGLMFGCQQGQNWLALADYLQYECVEVLRSLSIG
ncbi:hypothetical protein [Pseudomonas chlororaphis]|uniref:hypothetical protein n=1 Tax=Pseudomonas chlororaphis TaxID=587753 RepID=UPI0003D3AC31|nr:hypothetical protein [Pseudomonas chlororaphis]AZD28356.1 hypothetical protein C4K23_1591 [Pseudomonas chlororaphis]ETD37028.1 hypothetical protein U724_15975 [Pseudomonas chlororaphis subsp. aurantiaca PB-St2]QFS53925.1 hypothetical protein FD951_04880 [Pseudomonas chlororaphis subsp. aurantiaca]